MITPELQTAIKRSLDEATQRGHEFAGLEHLLLALLDDPKTAEVLKGCNAKLSALREELERYLEDEVLSLDEDEREPARPSVGFQRIIQRAAEHVISSQRKELHGYNVLVAMFAEPSSHAVYFLKKAGITRLDLVSYISHGTGKPVSGMDERSGKGGKPSPSERVEPNGGTGTQDEEGGEQDPLEAFTTNLNRKAEKGDIDPLIGRSKEVDRAIQILARRRKNNPLLLGDPGVGKTAIVEGIARRIVTGEVPEFLKDATIYSLEMGSLLAGTRYRGDFESRIKTILKALMEQPKPILFIDEFHTVVRAGAVEGGAMDASNLLKPTLSEGKLRVIGATTYKEFRGFIERDPALLRRFQKLDVDEPSLKDTIAILNGLKKHYEEYHKVIYSPAALKACVVLSDRYLRDKKLPDKAIDLLDESGAKKKLATPPGETGEVRRRDIEAVVSTMAQIPPRRVNTDDREKLRNIVDELKSKVFGQEQAVNQVAAAVKLSRAGLNPPERPIANFLFAGPTGVGKTELAKRLAEVLGVQFVRFDMSEYSERHTVSRLIGAPPGYVGFDQAGLLTDSISKNPHAVLLLDEIEKAHPDIYNILLQVMDHGTLTDNNGKKVDFRHVILIMTSNVGAADLSRRLLGFGQEQQFGDVTEAYKRAFSPEFRNRLDAKIDFAPLSPEIMGQVAEKFIKELASQLAEKRVTIELTEPARAWLAKKGYDPANGARPMARVIHQEVKRPLTEELLFGQLLHGGKVTLGADEKGLTFAYESAPPPPPKEKKAKKPVPALN